MAIDPNSPVTVACLTVATLEAASGTCMDVFILFVTLHNVNRKKNVHSGGAIRAAMTRSSIILTLMLISSLVYYIFFSKVNNHIVNIFFNMLAIYSINSSLYLTAIYCFFLFIKIAQFKSSALAWVKRRLIPVIPHLALVVEAFSFCCSFLGFFMAVKREVYTNSSAVSDSNVIADNILDHPMASLVLALFLVPYFFMAVTSILASGSLILHIHKMKSMEMTGAVSTKAYKTTVYKLMCFLILHTFSTVLLILAYFYNLTTNAPGHWTSVIIMFLLSPAKSLLLIYSNTNLRNKWKMMIGCIFHCKSFLQVENT